MGELGRMRDYTWWSLTGVTALVLAAALGPPLWTRPWAYLAVAAVIAADAYAFKRALDGKRAPYAVLAAGSLAATALAVLLWGDGDAWVLAPSLMLCGIAPFVPRVPCWIGLGVLTLATVPFGLGAAVILSMSVASTIAMLWAWDLARRLDRGRELAVGEERRRFAADLHDIQGHRLQVIAMKAELAERDPSRAAEELREVRRLAVEAISDTRDLVRGHRRVSLDAEIANAARVLTATGVQVITDVAEEVPDERARHLLGLAVREATTNVLRHSRALTVRIGWDGVVLRVSNDGVRPRDEDGTGLRGLSDRFAEAGGRVTWSGEGDRFELTATLGGGT